MLKSIKKIGKTLFVLTFGALIFFSLFLATLQTKWAKKTISEWLVAQAAKNGIEISIASIEGIPPFKWRLEDVHVKINAADALSIKNLHFRLSLLPFLKKHIALSYVKAEEAVYVFHEEEERTHHFLSQEEMKEALGSLSLPFSFSIRDFLVEPLLVENATRKKTGVFFLRGQGNIKPYAQAFHTDVQFKSPKYSRAQLSFRLDANAREDNIHSLLFLSLPDKAALEPFIFLPFDLDGSFRADLEGTWKSWRQLAEFDPEKAAPPLHGEVKAVLSSLEIPGHKEWDQKWSARSEFLLSPDLSLKINQLQLQSAILKFLAKGSLDNQGMPESWIGSLSLYDLSPFSSLLPFPISGVLEAHTNFSKNSALLSFSASNLKLGTFSFDSWEGNLEALKEEENWEGRVYLLSSPISLPVEAKIDFLYNPASLLAIREAHLTAPETEAGGAFFWDFSSNKLNGDFFASMKDISRFQKFFPHPISGSFGGKVHLSSEETQDAQFYAKAQNFSYRDFRVKDVTATAEILDLLGAPQGSITVEGEDINQEGLMLSSFQLHTESQKEKWPFSFEVIGNWKEPLVVESAGSWKKEGKEMQISFDAFTGTLLDNPFALEDPFTITKGKDLFQIEKFSLKFEKGHFSAGVELSQDKAQIEILAEHFPLDLITLAHPYFSLLGASSLDISLEGNQEKLVGRANILLEEATLSSLGKKNPLQAKGALQMNFSGEHMQILSSLKASGGQYLEFTATLPIDHQTYPFAIAINKNKPLSGEITVEGNLEEIFDFINIGSHTLTGNLSGRLYLSKNWLRPALFGEIVLKNGTYDNYYTGTYLKNITAEIKAENNELKLVCLEAEDDQGGSLLAHGDLSLEPEQKFPYQVHADLNNLHSVKFDWITGNLTGPLTIAGDSTYALGKGDLLVSEADINIPEEHVLSHVPVLPITYVNFPPSLQYTLPSSPVFPVQLDLNLSAPGKVYVRGKGLESEWQGNVHLTGTNTSFLANGTLSLVKGEFLFSGKVFTLTNGEITFSDKPHASAYLNLSGTLAISDVTIHAFLRGPLNSPVLTFQSSPHLPTSSILSLILFNKDISEITPMQAIQLAQAVVSLSGGKGANILETIRKRLGVDKLNIVSTGDSDEITVQIGKYITKGVMVTLSQSQTNSNIIVEVDLSRGFIFQAETQEEEEGKFSLKWNRNY